VHKSVTVCMSAGPAGGARLGDGDFKRGHQCRLQRRQRGCHRRPQPAAPLAACCAAAARRPRARRARQLTGRRRDGPAAKMQQGFGGRRQVHFAVLVCRAVPLPASTCKSARLLTKSVRSPCQLCAASNPLQAGTVLGMQGTLASSRACARRRAAAPRTRGTLSQLPQAPPARRQSAGPRSSGAACAYKAPGSLAHGRFTGRKQAAHAKLSLTSAY